jgi:hypothetical protein
MPPFRRLELNPQRHIVQSKASLFQRLKEQREILLTKRAKGNIAEIAIPCATVAPPDVLAVLLS